MGRQRRIVAAADVERAFNLVRAKGADAINVLPDGTMMRHREKFVALAAEQRIPVVSGWQEFTRAGGIMSYGPNVAQTCIGVIVNRPFREGELLRKLERHPLPGWAAEIGCASWAQIILKFIISHPVVTCAIPATTRVDHVRENMAAATGLLPDQAMRARMIARVENF